ncbi:transposase [Flavihumibacter sp. UBA7668]|uniref:transposase n=1 Tax=Flavihumibacter sp. UBA7668 TaxID=1946542 RepID=UPI0025C1620D|nr:transposase [Flavihumibacter sp. UBA7668]
MNIIQDNLYHIYNRGNQKQRLFHSERNYNFFLGKIILYIQPHCDILSYALMPNHYHLLIHANQHSAELIDGRILAISNLSEGVRLMQSTYTKAFNSEHGICGNLFQQKAKSKPIEYQSTVQAINTFHYIHKNPVESNLVTYPEDWTFSSFREYLNPHLPGICNKNLAIELLDLDYRMFNSKQKYY